MSVSVNLWSTNSVELNDFLERFYQKNIDMDDDARGWICEYLDPLKSVDIISAVMDNSDRYRIVAYVQVNRGELYRVTEENYNDVIKGLFILFYEEPDPVNVR